MGSDSPRPLGAGTAVTLRLDMDGSDASCLNARKLRWRTCPRRCTKDRPKLARFSKRGLDLAGGGVGYAVTCPVAAATATRVASFLPAVAVAEGTRLFSLGTPAPTPPLPLPTVPREAHARAPPTCVAALVCTDATRGSSGTTAPCGDTASPADTTLVLGAAARSRRADGESPTRPDRGRRGRFG